MNKIKIVFKTVLGLLLVVYTTAFAFSETAADDESLYQLKFNLIDQNNRQIKLDVYRGQPTLIAMFYAHCPYACPLTINTLQHTIAELEPKDQKQLRVLLVSLDPARDTVKLLTETVKKHTIDTSRWSLARTDISSVRKLTAVLGVRFRELPDGEFNHSSIITLLDARGVAVAHSKQQASADPMLLIAIRKLLLSPQ